MRATIQSLDRFAIAQLISSSEDIKLTQYENEKMQECLLLASSLYVGTVDKKLVCIWGLIPPTLMSEQAYLWLYASALVKDHEFLFVRNSQRAVEKMLEEFSTIVGHVHSAHSRSIRWLRWLGASFKEPDGVMIPFVIRKKSCG